MVFSVLGEKVASALAALGPDVVMEQVFVVWPVWPAQAAYRREQEWWQQRRYRWQSWCCWCGRAGMVMMKPATLIVALEVVVAFALMTMAVIVCVVTNTLAAKTWHIIGISGNCCFEGQQQLLLMLGSRRLGFLGSRRYF
jgi:hypothetical protein